MRYATERGLLDDHDWHIATCDCGWLRAELTYNAARQAGMEHAKKCKEGG